MAEVATYTPFFARRKRTQEPQRSHNFDIPHYICCCSPPLFLSIVLTGVKCWKPDWPRWIFVKISEQKAHVLWGRFTAIITKRSRLHLPHANWWQANQQHARKTTVPLCWHCCRSLTRFFFLSSVSLCLFLSLSPAPSVSLPLSSLRLLHLYHISFFFFFFAPELSFSPLLLLFPLLLSLFSRSSLHPRPCGPGEVAGWQKPDPLVSQVPYLAYEVLLSVLRVCVSRALFSRAKWGVRGWCTWYTVRRGGRSEGKEWRERLAEGGREKGRWRPGLSCLRWVRLLLDLSLVIKEPCGSPWKCNTPFSQTLTVRFFLNLKQEKNAGLTCLQHNLFPVSCRHRDIMMRL